MKRNKLRVFTEKLYDTLFGNTQYEQLDFNKINDQWVDYKGEIAILYGRTAYRIKIEQVPGYHDDLTTI